jgi:N-acetylglutamate synthase/N-acetylornithine aminotransferase
LTNITKWTVEKADALQKETDDLAIHLVKHGEAVTAALAPAVKGAAVVKRARKKNTENAEQE